MKWFFCFALASIAFIQSGCQNPSPTDLSGKDPVTVVYSADASSQEILAAKEIRRYLYLRSDRLVELVKSDGKLPPNKNLIIVGQKDSELVKSIISSNNKLKNTVESLTNDESRLKTLDHDGRKVVLVTGGDNIGTLYGAYRFIEQFGIRFQLHIDAIPDKKIALELPNIDETHKPIFDIRGLNTWGAHAEGIDAWDSDKFKAVFTQMTKMGMNSMAIHSYPEHAGLGTEPAVWIGLPEDIDENGDVLFSSDSTYWNTKRSTWGYKPQKTGDFRFGGSLLFESDDWGSWIMGGQFPSAKEFYGRNEVFNRAGNLYKDAFTFARQMGVKTTLGTEAGVLVTWDIVREGKKITLQEHGPSIAIPNRVKERLIEKGKDPKDPKVLEEIYEGIFRRIDKKHPLDYYMLYTQENWYWGPYTKEMFDSFVDEFKIAYRAWEKVNPEFDLAVCGWILGPDFDHSAFDKVLPKHVAISEMSRAYNAPVDEGFGRMQPDRPRWAIPWIEEDSPIITPSLWASRVRKDAADALAYGCTGLMTLHWRTRILEPSSAAMAKACWDQSGWNPEFGKARPGVPENKFLMTTDEEMEGASYKQGANGGQLSDIGAIAISKTEDDKIYQSNRFGLKGYELKVPNGKYKVVLKFCEPSFNEPGKRIFDISLQGKVVREKLDIFAEVGIYTALDLNFDNVVIEDNILKLGFIRSVSAPCIMGLEVYGDGYSRKINVGGEDFKDFEGDTSFWRPTPVLMFGEGRSKFKPRGLPTEDFYADWCLAMFGPEVADDTARFFSRLDSHVPLIGDWTGVNGGGAGGLAPDGRGWDKVSREYKFVDEFEKIRHKVHGEGNLERFDYWLNNFRYTRATANAECLWGDLTSALNKARMAETEEQKKTLARKLVLPVYKELVSEIGNALKYHMATISTVGGMQTVLNWEGHNKLLNIDASGIEIAEMLGEDLPKDAIATKDYQGEPRIVVPTLRTVLNKNESLKLKVIILDNKPVKSAELYYRPLGKNNFSKVNIRHVNRAVYTVSVPQVKEDIEYYIKAETSSGKELVWPATTGNINQSIVVIP